MRFAESLSLARDPIEAVEAVCAAGEGAFTDAAPNLGFLFFSVDHAPRILDCVEEIRNRTGVRNLLGCTGESIIGCGREIEGRPALGLWLASLPDVRVDVFRLGCEQTPDGYRFPTDSPGIFENAPENAAAILLGEPFSFPADIYLKRFNEDHPGLRIVGGMASGARNPGEILLLRDGETFEDGGVGVLLSGAVRVSAVVSQGCRPVGKPLVVTECDRNAIFKLGGRKALPCLQQVFADLSAADRQLFHRAPHLGIVMNETQAGFGPGDFLIRNLVGIDPGREAIFVSDCLRLGQTIQFHVRDGPAASRDLDVLLDAEKAGRTDETPGGGLMFSCNGRGTRLFETADHDISAVRAALGEIPVSGFFAQGELGPVGGRNHLHGFTACVALFSEV